MAQERIDSIIDQSAIEAEINFLNDNLTQLETKIGSFGKVVGNVNGAKGFSRGSKCAKRFKQSH
jgi:hypothetical protein